MNARSILEKVSSLRLLFDPSWVDGCPGCPGPIFNPAIADYAIAGVLRDMAVVLKDKNGGEALRSLARKMVEKSSQGLMAGWDEGDDICPPWRFPFPHGPQPNPWTGTMNGPRPEPWLQSRTQFDTRSAGIAALSAINTASFSSNMDSLMLAGALKHLASLTTDPGFSSELFAIGQQLVKQAAADVFDDFCGTVTHPRPLPHYNVTAQNA